jgi:hypothetical protein
MAVANGPMREWVATLSLRVILTVSRLLNTAIMQDIIAEGALIDSLKNIERQNIKLNVFFFLLF